MSSSSHHLEEISLKSTTAENPVRLRHNKVKDTEIQHDDQTSKKLSLENVDDRKSVEKEGKNGIKKKAIGFLGNVYAYQRHLIALPIWNWFSQRFPVADNQTTCGTKANPVFILQHLTRHFNNQLSKESTKGEKKTTLSLDEADLIVVIIWVGITPCLIVLFACTHFVKNALLITGTWIYPTLLTYAHLEQHSYPKVGYFIVAWVLFSFTLLLEQYYLQVIQYTPSNLKSNYPSLLLVSDGQDNLSLNYILIKILVIYILLNPKWELIIPLIRSIALYTGKYRQIMGVDWEKNLHCRHLMQEKMIKQSFPADNDIGETKNDNAAESADKQIDEISSTTISKQDQTNDDIEDEDAGDKKIDEISSNTTPELGETKDENDDEDNFSYVHVEGTVKEMGDSVQKEYQNIPSTILCDKHKNNDIGKTASDKKDCTVSEQVTKEHL